LLSIGEIKDEQHVDEMVKRLGIGYGEADVFRLFKKGSFDIISSESFTEKKSIKLWGKNRR